MLNPELLGHLRQLSRAEKFQIIQVLTAEFAKDEGIIIGNEAAELIGVVQTSHVAAQQLMQFK